MIPAGPTGAKEYEFDMALDFAECAESAGPRDGAEEAWEQEIEEYLGNAQDYIADR